MGKSSETNNCTFCRHHKDITIDGVDAESCEYAKKSWLKTTKKPRANSGMCHFDPVDMYCICCEKKLPSLRDIWMTHDNNYYTCKKCGRKEAENVRKVIEEDKEYRKSRAHRRG